MGPEPGEIRAPPATICGRRSQLGGEVPSGVVEGNDPAEAVPNAEHPDLARLGILDRVDRASGEVRRAAVLGERVPPAGEVRRAGPALPRTLVVGAGFNGLYVKKTSQQAIEGYRPIFDAFMDLPGAKHNQLPFKTLE